ncbi:MAG: DUF4357 domain-containing protein [Gammaproteobacteria bacterium]|nr:DUF4357 domain-containing protein [Gammaproteobacteria bacterium]
MDIHESESKGVKASGYSSGDRFIILKGSHAVDDAQVKLSLAEKPARVTKRLELISKNILLKEGSTYVFKEDVEFNSPSEAASIVWGSNLNGRLVFGLDDTIIPSTHTLYFEIDSDKAVEGYKKDRVLSVGDRNRSLVKQRKKNDNYTCQACGLLMQIGNKAVIECHHLNPIALGERETTIEDLVSLCPTCHRIAHMREPIYTVREVSNLLSHNKKIQPTSYVGG